PSSPAPRGQAENRVAVRQLVRIAGTELIRAERPSGFELLRPLRHRGKDSTWRPQRAAARPNPAVVEDHEIDRRAELFFDGPGYANREPRGIPPGEATLLSEPVKNLTSRCKSSTNENVRERGEDDARAGRVRFLRADPQQPFLTAIVRGSDKVYQTRIDWQEASDDILIVDCPCPYAADHTVCKHVWATLVEMDRFSFDLRVPGSGPLSLRPAKAEAEEPTVTYSFPFPFAHPDSATSRRQARPVAPPALRSAPAP